jgi:hypothetical protein
VAQSMGATCPSLVGLFLCKMYMEAAGFDPRTSPNTKLHNTPLTNIPAIVPCYICGQYLFKLICVYGKGGSGRGLAPTHGFIVMYMTIYIYGPEYWRAFIII